MTTSGALASPTASGRWARLRGSHPIRVLRWLRTGILATVTGAQAMSAVVGGLRPRGRMIVVGASGDPMQIPPFALIPGGTGVIGHASGTSKDSEDTLRFSALQQVRR